MITSQYRQLLVELHRNQSWGNAGRKFLPDVLRMILHYKLRNPTVLDYGAGGQTLEHWAKWALPHVKVTSYDPGIVGINVPPAGAFDIVVCTDVLEHVEPQFVDQTLDALRAYTARGAVINIACTPAKTHLPDGRNAHLTVLPPAWWMPRLQQRWKEIELVKGTGKGLFVYAFAV